MASIIKVEGIGEVYTQKLVKAGILTTAALLERGATREGRKELAESTEISAKLILRWVNMVDLFRIKGIGEEYSDLLEAAGVDTIPELAQRNPDHLYETMKKVNQEKKLVRHLPGSNQVKDWTSQAKLLPRIVTY